MSKWKLVSRVTNANLKHPRYALLNADELGFEAKRTGRAKDYKIWTDDNHAIEIFGYISIEEKVNYIHQNPVKAMIVYSAEQYVFSSAIDYADGIGLIKIIKY